MPNFNKKSILTACYMSFNGKTDAEVAAALGTSVSSVSRWRIMEIWQKYEQELLEAYKASLTKEQKPVTP